MIGNHINRIAFIPLFLLVNNCGLPPQGHLGHSTNTQVVLSEANYMVGHIWVIATSEILQVAFSEMLVFLRVKIVINLFGSFS